MAREIIVRHGSLDVSAVGQLGVVKAGTAHTLTGDDMGQLIQFTNAGAVTFTIPSDKTAPDIKPGQTVTVVQFGTGKVSFAGAAGVTVNAPGGLLGTSARYAEIWATKLDSNSWIVNGSVG